MPHPTDLATMTQAALARVQQTHDTQTFLNELRAIVAHGSRIPDFLRVERREIPR